MGARVHMLPRSPDEVEDVYVHVERETDAGLVVSGAKVVATGSALTHYNFVGHPSTAAVKTKRFAATFIVEMAAPGVKLICRPSYAMTAEVMGSPFDYPLSSRLDENDAILVLDHEVLDMKPEPREALARRSCRSIRAAARQSCRRPVNPVIESGTERNGTELKERPVMSKLRLLKTGHGDLCLA